MIPTSDENFDFEVVEPTTKTYYLDTNKNRIYGSTDKIEAMKQAIYLILNTERYKYLIYSWNYGVELVDLIGKPIPLAMVDLERRIKEALLQDNRIIDVTNFVKSRDKHKVSCTFTVKTIFGDIDGQKEVTLQ